MFRLREVHRFDLLPPERPPQTPFPVDKPLLEEQDAQPGRGESPPKPEHADKEKHQAGQEREEITGGDRNPVKCPVLMIHGLDDKALLPAALNDTWTWLEKDLTLITVPGAGHFVHRDRPELVTRKVVGWLTEK
jgi:pimeloyl-ACP methyl ester carboxylesterase